MFLFAQPTALHTVIDIFHFWPKEGTAGQSRVNLGILWGLVPPSVLLRIEGGEGRSSVLKRRGGENIEDGRGEVKPSPYRGKDRDDTEEEPSLGLQSFLLQGWERHVGCWGGA